MRRQALIAILAVQHRSRDYEAEAWALFDRGGEPIKALRLLAEAAPTIPPDTFARTADLGDVLRRAWPPTRMTRARGWRLAALGAAAAASTRPSA